jgi:hypothetical protein
MGRFFEWSRQKNTLPPRKIAEDDEKTKLASLKFRPFPKFCQQPNRGYGIQYNNCSSRFKHVRANLNFLWLMKERLCAPTHR